MMNDIIVALATAPMESAIAVIRVSGDECFDLLKNIFSKEIKIEGHKAYFGNIINGDEIIDEVIITTFVAPKSFTGENSFEINCHGGMFIVNKIIQTCIKNGARMANRGEFSKRAYLNGKIDLIQAEAINDMIRATSEEESKLAVMSLKGSTSKMIAEVKERMIQILSNIEVNIDYPEYDDAEVVTKEVAQLKLLELRKKIKSIIKDAKIGKIIKDGIKVAIVGKPNVGKSSLLNALLEEEKAIVTNVAGTTRDIVEGQVNIDGLKLNLLDTAGIRNSEDSVEKIGIEKSKKLIEEADLILLVLDASRGIDEEDVGLIELTKNKNVITVVNKIELNEGCVLKGIKVSAKNKNLECLKEEIKKKVGYSYNYENRPLLTNSRQIGLLESSLKNIENGLKELDKGVPIDLVSIDLSKALLDLEDILGNRSKVNLSEEIFSRFCLGK